jgi:hypothetical protein
MFHPVVQLLASRPDLLVDHLAAYAPLMAAQAGEATSHWRRQALLVAVQGVGVIAGVGLGGAALLLLAVVPVAQMPMPWLLVAVPLAPLAVAAVCALLQRWQPPHGAFALLREQLSADAELLRQPTAP